jgi:thioester reductase-like protein
MSLVLFTGFPGFLGSELVRRLLARHDEIEALCLVQRQFAVSARERADEIAATLRTNRCRIRLVEGDITKRELGGNIGRDERRAITEIFHLAAIYDLSVARDVGMTVNVNGTRHVLDLALRCPGLERVHHVSTCYVSGRWEGTFHEKDLELGQQFNNYYEETKYLAEVEVRQQMYEGLPATIYRPAIVVGDSSTGATQKYDGPYYVMRWILRQPRRVAVVPIVGDPSRTELNVVPCDYVIDAIDWLSASPCSSGMTYQLADPEPLTVDGVLHSLETAVGKRLLRVPLTPRLAKLALGRVPGVGRLLGIPSAAVDYFVHPTHYDTSHTTRDLNGSGIAVPRFEDYVAALVAFMRQHPEIGSAAMA